jgi:hypothetical protein
VNRAKVDRLTARSRALSDEVRALIRAGARAGGVLSDADRATLARLGEESERVKAELEAAFYEPD